MAYNYWLTWLVSIDSFYERMNYYKRILVDDVNCMVVNAVDSWHEEIAILVWFAFIKYIDQRNPQQVSLLVQKRKKMRKMKTKKRKMDKKRSKRISNP